MKFLFEKFLKEAINISKNNKNGAIDIHSEEIENLYKKYATITRIHIKNNTDYGTVFTNEEFANCVESGLIISSDGIGYYIGKDMKETKENVDFNEETIRNKAKEYPYVFWYNK